MRPFGNDITNIQHNSGSAGNNDPNDGNGNRNNDNNNLNTGDGEGLSQEVDPRIPPHIARIGGIGTFPTIAGQGVIRVVQRCEEAKENHRLGKIFY